MANPLTVAAVIGLLVLVNAPALYFTYLSIRGDRHSPPVLREA